jgi:hypothetical protein
MPQVQLQRSARIPARPELVYAILADYRREHPRILPAAFTGLALLRGGVGAGTELLVTMRVAGRASAFRLLVDEPEPGRVLRERDPASGQTTTFTLAPLAGGVQTQVQITTVWEPRAGAAGWAEAHLTRLIMRGLYDRELRLLANYAAAKQAARA